MKDRWKCECGARYEPKDVDERVELGSLVFRKKPCDNCRRPVQLESSLIRRGGSEEPVSV